MTPTKDQQAQEYAEKKDRAMRKAWYEYRFGPIREYDDWENHPVKPSDNFEKGFMAGYTACEQSLWRSVEEELPEDGKIVLALDNDWGYVLAVRHAGKWKDINKINPEYKEYRWEQLLDDVSFPIVAWMPIPSLPDTNTEKI